MGTFQHEAANPDPVAKARAVERGRRADEIINDELSREVWDDVRRRLVEQWEGETDPERRERLWYEVHALESLKVRFRAIIGDGEHAKAVLQKLQ